MAIVNVIANNLTKLGPYQQNLTSLRCEVVLCFRLIMVVISKFEYWKLVEGFQRQRFSRSQNWYQISSLSILVKLRSYGGFKNCWFFITWRNLLHLSNCYLKFTICHMQCFMLKIPVSCVSVSFLLFNQNIYFYFFLELSMSRCCCLIGYILTSIFSVLEIDNNSLIK